MAWPWSCLGSRGYSDEIEHWASISRIGARWRLTMTMLLSPDITNVYGTGPGPVKSHNHVWRSTGIRHWHSLKLITVSR